MMEWDHYEYKIAEHYLSVLINADDSGMDPEECAIFDAWMEGAGETAKAAGFTISHWTDVEDSGEDWGICAVSGLYAMRCTVRLMVYK